MTSSRQAAAPAPIEPRTPWFARWFGRSYACARDYSRRRWSGILDSRASQTSVLMTVYGWPN